MDEYARHHPCFWDQWSGQEKLKLAMFKQCSKTQERAICAKKGEDGKVSYRRRKSTAAAAKLLQSCPTLCMLSHFWLCDPMDWSPPGSSVQENLQARILEWVAIAFSRGSSRPRDGTHVSCTGRWILHHWHHHGPTRMGVSKLCNLFVHFDCHFSLYPQLSTITASSFTVEKAIRCHDSNKGFRITNPPLVN